MVVSEIVVPLGGLPPHDRALRIAAHLAERLGVSLRFLHVDDGRSSEPGIEETLATARAELRRLHPSPSPSWETIGNADVGAGIASSLGPHSLVVMATSRAGDPATPLSTAEALVRRWNGPVLLVGPNARAPTWDEQVYWEEPIVVPLDGSPAAERAIPFASWLAESLDVPLWLVQVVSHATRSAVMELRSAGEPVSESAYVRGVADSASDESRNVGWDVVYDDDPAAALLQFACDYGASFIVATTRGLSGVQRLTFGSVCMALARADTHGVVVLGPEHAADVAALT